MASANAETIVFTIGHSTRTVAEFITLLTQRSVRQLVDVRTVPRSRHNPQFNQDTFPSALAAAHIHYSHVAGLGGFRRTSPQSPNRGWRNASFRGYADYMQTPEFAQSLAALIKLAKQERVAIMCAEAVPWRCHRSLIADALVIHDCRVEEIISGIRAQPHTLTSFAKVNGAVITYPCSDAEEPVSTNNDK